MFSRFLEKLERIAQFNIFSIAHQNHISRSKLCHVYSAVRCFQSGRFVCGDKYSLRHWSQSPTRVFGNRVSRAMRNEAQKALFDYLHYTRTLSFVDAEHIGKNSPRFVLALLSKIDDTRKEDISRSLTKFLSYNPINEFEPFFESLGLRPSEILRFIQRDVVLLSDGSTMFENFHVLCYYGIPHDKIGRLYKEAREIFVYENGVLALKLEAYERLVLRKAIVIKLVTCCPLLLVGGIDCEFVSVVNKLKGLNLGCDWLARYLSVKKTYNWRRILETMELLEKVGFKEKKLSNLLKRIQIW